MLDAHLSVKVLVQHSGKHQQYLGLSPKVFPGIVSGTLKSVSDHCRYTPVVTGRTLTVKGEVKGESIWHMETLFVHVVYVLPT